uniref:Probable DNA polymerase n=1 Tax=Microbotryum cf. violaceum BFL-2013 TaxID=1288119 RepID=M1GMG6_9BASI|nr:DNA polymerase [Microbotryum cf. violaceum BFL-2013]AGE14629.1 DNA polymerase [Microbotryum cf. violaceum BFL-2013]
MTNRTLNNLKPLLDPSKLKPIATIGIETINSTDGVQIPVMLTAYVQGSIMQYHLSTFMINGETTEVAVENMFKKFFDDFLIAGNGHIVYLHNLGLFDGYFLAPALLNSIENIKDLQVLIDADQKYILIKLNDKIRHVKVEFKDSLRILPMSLNSLASTYNVKGKTEKYDSQWQDLQFHLKNNPLNPTVDWIRFKEYSDQDVLCLYKIMVKTQEWAFTEFNIDLALTYSTASLAVRVYRTKFLPEIESLHKILENGTVVTQFPLMNPWLDSYIREAYYGGSTDYFKLYGEKLHYYDVNSLYPAAMKIGVPGQFIRINTELDSLDNFYGYVLAKIVYKGDEVPLLPYRMIDGTLIYPKGEWIGLYFSEEVKEAIKYGYNIIPLKGYEFEKIMPFNNYVDYFYELKSTSTGFKRTLNKLLLNTLYGYFGRAMNVNQCLICEEKELDNLLLIDVVDNYRPLGTKGYMVLLKTNLSKKMITEINKATGGKGEGRKVLVTSNVSVAAAVTANARIIMMKYKRLPNNTLFYTDTDSVFLQNALDPNLCNSKLGFMRDELSGKVVDKAYFLGTKQYCYTYYDDSNKLCTKSVFAGIKRDSLSLDDFKQMSQKKIITIEDKGQTFYRNFIKQTITVSKTPSKFIQMNSKKALSIDNTFITPTIDLKYVQYTAKLQELATRILKKFIRKMHDVKKRLFV